MTTATAPTVPLFINGQHSTGNSSKSADVFNPSTGEVIAHVKLCTPEQAGEAAVVAANAFPDWNATPVVERARVMFRFLGLLENHFEELAALVTREHGKTLAESRAEVQRGVEMVEFACGIPSLITGETLANIAPSVDAETVRHPVGVCVGITPYNFPVMVPMWMFPTAIVCGNTFVLKTVRKSTSFGCPIRRVATTSRITRWSVQRGPRRSNLRGNTPDAPPSSRHLVRWFNTCRQVNLRNWHQPR